MVKDFWKDGDKPAIVFEVWWDDNHTDARVRMVREKIEHREPKMINANYKLIEAK